MKAKWTKRFVVQERCGKGEWDDLDMQDKVARSGFVLAQLLKTVGITHRIIERWERVVRGK